MARPRSVVEGRLLCPLETAIQNLPRTLCGLLSPGHASDQEPCTSDTRFPKPGVAGSNPAWGTRRVAHRHRPSETRHAASSTRRANLLRRARTTRSTQAPVHRRPLTHIRFESCLGHACRSIGSDSPPPAPRPRGAPRPAPRPAYADASPGLWPARCDVGPRFRSRPPDTRTRRALVQFAVEGAFVLQLIDGGRTMSRGEASGNASQMRRGCQCDASHHWS